MRKPAPNLKKIVQVFLYTFIIFAAQKSKTIFNVFCNINYHFNQSGIEQNTKLYFCAVQQNNVIFNA